MLTLRDLAARETSTMLAEHLPRPPARILEVGCGQGHLAEQLGAEGYVVTGLEPDADGAEAARRRGVDVRIEEILDHRPTIERYEVVLFTRSLHHIDPLDDVVAHAFSLLVPGGRVVAEEFGRERADRLAAGFFYDVQAVVAAAVDLPPDEDDADSRATEPNADPLARWQVDYTPEPGEPLHSGEEVVAALRGHASVAVYPLPGLWRHLLHPADQHEPEAAARLAPVVLALERRRIAEGTMSAVGFLAVADAPTAWRPEPRGRR